MSRMLCDKPLIGRSVTASQVCFTCKGRKKKCDKKMPQCGYCEQKDIDCCYDYGGESDLYQPVMGISDSTLQYSSRKDLQATAWETDHSYHQSSKILTQAIPITSLLDPVTLGATLSLEVMRIIQASHQSTNGIGTRYFKGIHLWVPFFCPNRFQKDVVQFQTVPTAEFSLLLLCICLITYDPPQHQPPPVGRDALYLQAKTLFTHIQVLRRPSNQLIQAGIFISMYEYAHGRPDSALASIDIYARMAHKAGLHQKPERPGWSDGWNTWWAIRIFERIFYCETTLTDLPLITSAPEEMDLLPHEVGEGACEESSKSSGQVAPVSLGGVGCLGRAAQAAYLLDQVIQTRRRTAATNQISSLIVLDSELQRLLFTTMNSCHGKRSGHCGAVGISIRALFILHKHILRLDTTSVDSQWRKHSQAALDTVTQMVVDIARSHRRIHNADVDIIAPSCSYVVRHALQYLYEKRYADSNAWFLDSDTLRESLNKVNGRWPVEPGLSSDY
ncbi:hypothetical protein EJ02DRAFT_456896 [Clathrospora elynae]|uniref:Zn(2)-C6 fungal-type domain-containing protein n=1 Tax=Clathrospora elynae TaxID=706981 RepID=A0A6A5SI04_9PLEO|nr:hypothetical protein EJ02DRAFT_456896 [Clathrospora elynae]